MRSMVPVMDHSVPFNVSTVTGSISTSLLDRVKARDAEAWRRLTKIFGPVIYHWSRQAGLQEADAADVIQDVFAAVAANINGFHRQQPGDSFRGRLFTIARNKIRDHFRRRNGEADPEGGTVGHLRLQSIPESPDPSTVQSTLQSARSMAVRRTLEVIQHDFQDRTWQAFWDVAVEDKPASEVAEKLGMTLAAVHQAKYRVGQRLREELGDY
jgi:RNA polymerase sigma-70 factor (ECF subfamily)